MQTFYHLDKGIGDLSRFLNETDMWPGPAVNNLVPPANAMEHMAISSKNQHAYISITSIKQHAYISISGMKQHAYISISGMKQHAYVH